MNFYSPDWLAFCRRYGRLTIPLALVFWLLLLSAAIAQDKPFRRGYTNMTEFGVLFGRVKHGPTGSRTVENRRSLTVQSFNGILLTPRLAAGVTVGADWYESTLLTPIAAGIRYDLARPGQKNLRVFTSLDSGYGFTWLQEDADGYKTKGGWMISPGIGFRIGRPTGTNFILAMSYKRQESGAEKPLFWSEVEKSETRVYNRMAFRLGLSF